jgi:uncharacterized protein YeaO (DUF488 family)
MAVRVVRQGDSGVADEGLRIGTVRRPPRGVPKGEFAAQNWYDVGRPNLAPSPETLKRGQAAKTPAQRTAFIRRHQAEMNAPDQQHLIELLATLSHRANFAVGCYCEDEAHCHCSALRALLADKGARFA